MKNQTNQLRVDTYAEMHAEQAIKQITKLVEERYPQISAPTKSKLIAECLREIIQERMSTTCLN
jgi:hypothetical protein